MATRRGRFFGLCAVLLSLNYVIEAVKLNEAKMIPVKHLPHNSQGAYRQHRIKAPAHPTHQLPSPHPQQLQHVTLSVVMDAHKNSQQRFIHVQSTPSIYPPNNLLPIEYNCAPGEIAGIEVYIMTAYNQMYRVFKHHWVCSGHTRHSRKVFQKLKIPDSIVYQPDYINRDVLLVDKVKIRTWILPAQKFRAKRTGYYALADAKALYHVNVLPLYSRPKKNHERAGCLTWEAKIMLKYDRKWNGILQCAEEADVVHLVTFPLAFAGKHHGLSRDLPLYQNVGLQLYHSAHVNRPSFTISALLYVLEYCHQHLCSLIHRKTHYTNLYATPLIFMNKEGKTFIQIEQGSGGYHSMINNFRVPLNQWIQLVYVQDGKKWSLHILYGKNFSEKVVAKSMFPKDVHYNDTGAFYHLGGSDACPSYSGYLANARLWRRRAFDTEKGQFPPGESPDSVNYTHSISHYYDQCGGLHSAMNKVFVNYRHRFREKKDRESCMNVNPLLASVAATPPPPRHPFCHPWSQRSPRHQRMLWKLLRRAAAINETYNSTWVWVGKQLHQRVLKQLHAEGLPIMHQLLPMMKQASCCGNADASAMLATVYTGGLGTKSNESRALTYLLVAAQGGSRLAMLALANKHHSGTDDHVPKDMDYAYRYYQHVAFETIVDRTKHDASAISFEPVRLTSTEELKMQTGEDGDYFKWLKHQAKQGVADAQANVARMLYHGTSGVQRDMVAAANYYRMTAEQNLLDPVAQYDYAVVLLRGQGTEKNVEKGLEQLRKAAALGHPPAYTALGWYKLNFENDAAGAAEYFEQGDALGHRDASHNLGYLYLSGRYPGHPVDRMKAFEYYLKAAKQDHWDSGTKVAEMYNSGNEHMARNVINAVAWARYIAEKNVDVAWALRKGLDAYLDGSWSESLVYYTMAAETGLEVAQYNTAHLCEENHEDLVKRHIDVDCTWKYWKLASMATRPHVTSILKVGDYYWYGYGDKIDQKKAIQHYVQAAKSHQPQALFNLAYLLEKGTALPEESWISLGVRPAIYKSQDNMTKIAELYRMCRDGPNEEAYIPCGLALLNVQLHRVWVDHSLILQLASAVIVGLVTAFAFSSLYKHVSHRHAAQESAEA